MNEFLKKIEELHRQESENKELQKKKTTQENIERGRDLIFEVIKKVSGDELEVTGGYHLFSGEEKGFDPVYPFELDYLGVTFSYGSPRHRHSGSGTYAPTVHVSVPCSTCEEGDVWRSAYSVQTLGVALFKEMPKGISADHICKKCYLKLEAEKAKDPSQSDRLYDLIYDISTEAASEAINNQ